MSTAGTTFQITSMERAALPGAFSLFLNREVLPAREGWDARVTILHNGQEVGSLYLDRIDGEDAWHVSAEFSARSSMPRFMNGLFSRCTIPTLAEGDFAATLDAAAAERA